MTTFLYGELTSFPRAVMATEDELVVFSWIVYRDRETRDTLNKKVTADPRLASLAGHRLACHPRATRQNQTEAGA